MSRPRWHMPDLETLRALARRGLTMEQIASLGVSVRVLYQRKRANSQFLQAIKQGQAEGICAVANSLYENAMKGNVTAQIFYLKARAGWIETERKDITSNGETLSMVAIKAYLRELQNEPRSPISQSQSNRSRIRVVRNRNEERLFTLRISPRLFGTRVL